MAVGIACSSSRPPSWRRQKMMKLDRVFTRRLLLSSPTSLDRNQSPTGAREDTDESNYKPPKRPSNGKLDGWQAGIAVKKLIAVSSTIRKRLPGSIEGHTYHTLPSEG